MTPRSKATAPSDRPSNPKATTMTPTPNPYWDAKQWLQTKMEEHPHKDPHVLIIDELLQMILDDIPEAHVEPTRQLWQERVSHAWAIRRRRADENRAWDRASASISWGGQGGG